MATVVYSAHALGHIERELGSLRGESSVTAGDAVVAIQSAADHLALHPLVGQRIDGEIRQLILSYGKTGYVALYRFAVARDEVRILALAHQRQLDFRP